MVRRRHQIESRYVLICSIGEKAEPPPVKTSGKKVGINGLGEETLWKGCSGNRTQYLHLPSIRKFLSLITWLKEISGRRSSNRKSQIAFVLFPEQGSMSELKVVFRQHVNPAETYSLNYTPPLKGIILLRER